MASLITSLTIVFRLFRNRSKNASKLRVTGLCVGNSPVTGEFPQKWPVTREMCPFDDVIMWWQGIGCLSWGSDMCPIVVTALSYAMPRHNGPCYNGTLLYLMLRSCHTKTVLECSRYRAQIWASVLTFVLFTSKTGCKRKADLCHRTTSHILIDNHMSTRRRVYYTTQTRVIKIL